MNSPGIILVLTFSFLVNTGLASDWGYDGERGADRWHEHYKECEGGSQSPINVISDSSQFDAFLSDITLFRGTSEPDRMVLIHNGHTLQVNVHGDYYVYGGKLPSNYKVVQFHLHWGKHDHRGSEHQIDGHHFPMELHVVSYDYMNYDTIGKAMKSPMGLAVLGTLFTISDDDNPALEPLISAVKHIRDPDVKYTTPVDNLHLSDLLPSSLNRYYRYNGSLTTPGCHESVVWTVFDKTQTISRKQIKVLREILRESDKHGHDKTSPRSKLSDNFRPVQPLNGRSILRSFPKHGDLPTAALKKEHAVWSYKGDTGPVRWHEMYPDGGCGGRSQSPINIDEHQSQYSTDLTDFNIDASSESSSQMTVLNNGHTIKVSVEGDFYVRGGGLPENTEYKVAQLHFHWGGEDHKGSEHHLNGHAYPIELHIVSYDSRNYPSINEAATQPQGLAVLGVLYQVSPDDNLALQPLEDVMEAVTDPESSQKVPIPSLDLNKLIPKDRSRYFRYNGSLTTPGCFESVVWTVFRTPQTLSHKQLRQFRGVLKHQDDHGEIEKVMGGDQPTVDHGGLPDDTKVKIGNVMRGRLVDNFRPIQPINDRTVLRSYKMIDSRKRKGGSHKHHWGYTGHVGPSYWHEISEGCNGRLQSPINIITTQAEYNPSLTEFTFYDTPDANAEMSIINNGHTVQVNVKKGVHYVFGGGLPSTYQTAQLHFHWGSTNDKGSEHTVNGQAFPLELHVVNYDSGKYSSISEAADKPEGLAVLGTFFQISADDNPALQPIIDGFTHVMDPDNKLEKTIEPLMIEDLLPQDTKKYYRYNGSLTTPGCYESVIWTVFKNRMPISAKQMEQFREILLPDEEEAEELPVGSHGDASHDSHPTGPDEKNTETKPIENIETGIKIRLKMVDNFRPVQPINQRKVWRSFKVSGERKRKKGHWGYEGYQGPKHWAEMHPDKTCNGTKQSPIDIVHNQTKFDPNLRDINIFYDPPLPGSRMTILNNGHTVQVNLDGKYFITGSGLTKLYKTAQFHFHWGSSMKKGSEHTLDGHAYPLELHIVNYDSETYSSITEAVDKPMGLAVFGVFYTISEEDNPVLQKVIEALGKIQDPESGMAVELEPISVKYFLPPDQSRYYRYNGSLTTPGCYESVIWTVFQQTQSISQRQLEKFWKMFQKNHGHTDHHPEYNTDGNNPRDGNLAPHGGDVSLDKPVTTPKHKGRKRIRTNFRPVQALNQREVFRSFQDQFSDARTASSKQCNAANQISTLTLQSIVIVGLIHKLFHHL